ncbi:MAG: hypothetical protein R3293_08480 [Candidatus Promineifilaceae bacterium]|nr:hypothetical protein [Candidatus Promineifilaceae bacterium]
MKKRKTAIFSLVMAIVCFIVAAIPALGLVLTGDPIGRLIFTAVWAALGFVWVRHFRRAWHGATEE